MAERYLRVPEDVAREARHLARAATGVDGDRLAHIGLGLTVGRATLLALLASGVNGRVGAWAARSYTAQLDAERDVEVRSLTAAAVGDGDGVVYYGIHDPDCDVDMVSWVVRASSGGHDRWTGAGWEAVPDGQMPVGYRYSVLDGPLLADALTAVTEGRAGLVLRAVTPRVLLPKRVPLTASAGAVDGVYAVVDEVDTTAVVSLLHVVDGRCETRAGGRWVPGRDTLIHVVAAGVPVAAVPPTDLPVLLRAFDDHEAVFPIIAADVAPEDVGAAATDDPGDGDQPDFSDGVMVALPVGDDVARQLAVPGGLDPADMHVTLAYLGDQGDVPVDMDGLAELVSDWAAQQQPFQGEISGPATFEGTGNADNPVQVALVDVPDLPTLRQSLVDHLESNDIPVNNGHGFTPHVSRAYSPDPLGNGIGGDRKSVV